MAVVQKARESVLYGMLSQFDNLKSNYVSMLNDDEYNCPRMYFFYVPNVSIHPSSFLMPNNLVKLYCTSGGNHVILDF